MSEHMGRKRLFNVGDTLFKACADTEMRLEPGRIATAKVVAVNKRGAVSISRHFPGAAPCLPERAVPSSWLRAQGWFHDEREATENGAAYLRRIIDDIGKGMPRDDEDLLRQSLAVLECKIKQHETLKAFGLYSVSR